jgi:hypothetical protein
MYLYDKEEKEAEQLQLEKLTKKNISFSIYVNPLDDLQLSLVLYNPESV